MNVREVQNCSKIERFDLSPMFIKAIDTNVVIVYNVKILER